jgi:TonB family protein
LRQWTFEPAQLNGQPVAAVSEVAVQFNVEGPVLVSTTGIEPMESWIYRLTQTRTVVRAHDLRELDRVPRLVATVAPAHAGGRSDRGLTGDVTVHFYIDESGAVRLPYVDPTENTDLAALAVPALQQWRFEVPTCHGQPVVVKASQRFHFQVAAPKPAQAAPGGAA